ncbi:hypothetical protein [Marinicellulosiphila megalodicopiae]|uniref:hypothetical protein n=1 Tax=Marinicellulosiphila megalodicopiae TaxID=2724896 RepID=UPI003BAEA059
MSIKKTLLLAFGVLSLMIILLLSVSLFSSFKTQVSTTQLIHDHEVSRGFTAVAINAQAIRRYEKEYFIYLDHEKREKYWNEWSETKNKISAILDDLEKNLPMCGQAALVPEVQRWREALDFYASEFTKLNQQVIAGNISTTLGANDAVQDGKNRFKELLDGVDTQIESIFQEAKIHADNAQSFNVIALIIIAVISFVAVIIAVVSFGRVPKSVSFPIVQLTELTTLISKGKANEMVKIGGSPEIVELSKSVERLRVATNGLMERYKTSKGQYENLRDRILAAKKRKNQ